MQDERAMQVIRALREHVERVKSMGVNVVEGFAGNKYTIAYRLDDVYDAAYRSASSRALGLFNIELRKGREYAVFIISPRQHADMGALIKAAEDVVNTFPLHIRVELTAGDGYVAVAVRHSEYLRAVNDVLWTRGVEDKAHADLVYYNGTWLVVTVMVTVKLG